MSNNRIPFQLPLQKAMEELDVANIQMPRMAIDGFDPYTPESHELLERWGGIIKAFVMKGRQTHYTSTVGYTKLRADYPECSIVYSNNNGIESVVVTPRPEKVVVPEDTPMTGPCRWIIIERVWQGDSQIACTRAPDLGIFTVSDESDDPDRFMYYWAKTDGHSLFSRYEVATGQHAGAFVGTYGDYTFTGPFSWQELRQAMQGWQRPTLDPFVAERVWSPLWLYTPTYNTFATPESSQLAFGFTGYIPPTTRYEGTLNWSESRSQIVVIDVDRWREEFRTPFLKLRCTAWWAALGTVHYPVLAIPEQEGYPNGVWKAACEAMVGYPSPAEVTTVISRLWTPAHNGNREAQLADLYEFLLGDFNPVTSKRVYSPTRVAPLRFSRATDVYRTVISAREAGRNRVGSTQGFPPTVLPWGDLVGTLHYHTGTGEYAFSRAGV